LKTPTCTSREAFPERVASQIRAWAALRTLYSREAIPSDVSELGSVTISGKQYIPIPTVMWEELREYVVRSSSPAELTEPLALLPSMKTTLEKLQASSPGLTMESLLKNSLNSESE
jgi:hypothetical protein